MAGRRVCAGVVCPGLSLDSRLRHPAQAVGQRVVFAPRLELRVAAGAPGEDGVVNFDPRNLYALRNVVFDPKDGLSGLGGQVRDNGVRHFFYRAVVFRSPADVVSTS